MRMHSISGCCTAGLELSMKTLMLVVAWCLLWLLSLPFRLVAIVVDTAFALIHAVLLLPARLLRYRGSGGRCA